MTSTNTEAELTRDESIALGIGMVAGRVAGRVHILGAMRKWSGNVPLAALLSDVAATYLAESPLSFARGRAKRAIRADSVAWDPLAGESAIFWALSLTKAFDGALARELAEELTPGASAAYTAVCMEDQSVAQATLDIIVELDARLQLIAADTKVMN